MIFFSRGNPSNRQHPTRAENCPRLPFDLQHSAKIMHLKAVFSLPLNNNEGILMYSSSVKPNVTIKPETMCLCKGKYFKTLILS